MLNSAAVDYLGHSGFSVDFDGDVVIIDYFKHHLTNKWTTPLLKNPETYRSVTVLVSHGHKDHFNSKIFTWRKERPDITYVISADVREQAETELKSMEQKGHDIEGTPNIIYLERGGKAVVNRHRIMAFGSTDEGISFHVFSNNVSIFHAGDLNYWHWADEASEEEVRTAKEAFIHELKYIREEISDLDIAFFPVDPRMGTDFYRGAILFCEAMKPNWLVPMHYKKGFIFPHEFLNDINTWCCFTKLEPGRGPVEFERNPDKKKENKLRRTDNEDANEDENDGENDNEKVKGG